MSLVLKDINKTYPSGNTQIQVLKGLSADLKEGEITAIIGQSGSGKSTLLSILAGIEKPDSGEVWMNGVHFSSLNENEKTDFRGQNIGIIFQQFHLMSHLTALENVILPLQILGHSKKESVERASELLQMVGLEKRMQHLPSELSGGENQRVCIARSLSTKPKIILSDEPSGSLDVQTGTKIMELFFKIMGDLKCTTVLVTHDLSLAQSCHQVLSLQAGQLCKAGF